MTPSGRLRLFVAASVPGPLLAQLERATSPLRERWPSARWAPVANQHVTLKFLGSVDEGLLDPVRAAAATVALGHRASELRLGLPGVFPSRRRAKVLWIGIDDPHELLSSLAHDLESHLAQLGFPAEGRVFRPHLTLARFKDPVRVGAELPPLDLYDAHAFKIDRVDLFRSHLHPKGARYEILESFPLGTRNE